MTPNQIHCGDCAEIMDSWPDESVDLTVTSPPYDNLREYNGYKFDFKAIAHQLYSITKPGGVVVWIVADQTDKNGSESGSSFEQALHFKDLGFNLHDTMIWLKTNSIPQTSDRVPRFQPSFEYMFVFSKGRPKTFNPIQRPCKYAGHRVSASSRHRKKNGEKRTDGEKKQVRATRPLTNVWPLPTAQAKGFDHPAMFPLELPLRHIEAWSNPGDLILDPFCGSGTTLLAAAQLGRDFVGIDVSQEYCEMASRRLKKVTCQLRMDLPIMEREQVQGLHQHGGDRRSPEWNKVTKCNHERARGNSRAYIIARLERDFPEILDRLHNGEFRSVRQAAIAAGIVGKTR